MTSVTTKVRSCFFLSLVLCSLSFVLCACSHSGPNAYVRKEFDQSQIRKVAVFPFYNNTKVAEASKIVTGAFIAGLVDTRRFQVEFPGNIKARLKAMAAMRQVQLYKLIIEILAEYLDRERGA